MIIIETSIFTRHVTELLSDDEYRELQSSLVENPEKGSVITGTRGLRKIRCVSSGHGKRGGSRVIYYCAIAKQQILMLVIYAKNEKDDLSAGQLKVLKQIVEEEFYG
jgi:hypothetical protein